MNIFKIKKDMKANIENEMKCFQQKKTIISSMLFLILNKNIKYIEF